MYNHLLYLGYWIVNTTVLLLASFFIPAVRLGQQRFNSLESAVYAGFWLTFIIWVWWDFAIARRIKIEGKIANFTIFFIVNSLACWAVSRFYFVTGFVLTNYLWALIIGLMATFLQKIAWRVVVLRHF